MTPRKKENDPSPVFKFVAGMVLALTTAILVGLAIYKGTSFDGWVVLAAGIPSITAMIMMSDKLRDWVLGIASKLPFVNYTQKEDR